MDMTTWLETVPDRPRRRRKRKRKKLTIAQRARRKEIYDAAQGRCGYQASASILIGFGRCPTCVAELPAPDQLTHRFGPMPSEIVHTQIWKCLACGTSTDERLLNGLSNARPSDVGEQPLKTIEPRPQVIRFLRYEYMQKTAVERSPFPAFALLIHELWERLGCPVSPSSRVRVTEEEIEVTRDWLMDRGLYNWWDVQ